MSGTADDPHDSDLQAIRNLLQSQEERLSRIEAYLGLAQERATGGTETVVAPGEPAARSADDDLETRIGEHGLAWVGGIVFVLGIVFLMTYTFSLGHEVAGCLLGYCSAAGLFVLARVWRQSLPQFSRLTIIGSMVLLYYSTVQLHFFTEQPLVGNRHIELGLLIIAIGLTFFMAVRYQSQPVAFLGTLLGLATAILTDSTHISLPLAVVVACITIALAMWQRWWFLACSAIPLTYAIHMLWLLGNPIMGHPVRAVATHQYNLVYLFCFAVVFAVPTFRFTDESVHEPPSPVLVVFNCAAFSLMLFLASFALFRNDFAVVYFSAALLLLALSVAQWLATHQQFAPALYASFGFLAMSIAFYGYSGIPNAFLWLALQSLLVVSMALWFRSKILVVANSVIFLGILATYLLLSPSMNAANFSFALVAHASARIMNWQKERLTLRTGAMRNVYLLIAFGFMMYAIYHAVPVHYRSLSWTGAAIVYFLLSLALRNIKYRWMAMAALLLTIINLFFVDLGNLDRGFRVVAFLFLGVIALLISLFYSKFRGFLAKTDPERKS